VTVTVAALIPQTHVLWRIDCGLELPFIDELTPELYCTETGRPSIAPVLCFRMQLIGY
jgi:hypothetical protein